MQAKFISSTASQTFKRYNAALLGVETAQSLNFRMSCVLPNEGPPLHKHLEQAETFHISKGIFKFHVDGEEFHSEAGSTLFIPKGTPHSYLNIGDKEATLISVLTPGIHDGFILDLAKAEQEGASMEELTALAEQNGTVILGPPLGR